MEISQEAIELIVEEETGGRDYYTRHYQGFEWPAGASGPTVGCGFDCGYYTKDQIRAAWEGFVSEKEMPYLLAASGKTHFNGKAFVSQYRNFVRIPWETAMQQFAERLLPHWIDLTLKALPGAEKLPPDSLGAMVSLTFNRGNDYRSAGDRRQEMRLCRQMIEEGTPDALAEVPKLFRQMKRHWPPGHPNHHALTKRRDREADLFSKGLREMSQGGDLASTVESMAHPALPRAPAAAPVDAPTVGVAACSQSSSPSSPQ